MSIELILLRHGQSEWNLQNRFTGWVDVDLSTRGIDEARGAGRVLKEKGYEFDLARTSLLKRSIRTLWLVLEELDQMWIPVCCDWELNERHYGGLQGLNKREMAQIHGEEQVHIWRRSYSTRPPAMTEDQTSQLQNDPRYQSIAAVPASESLEDTYVRVVRFWQDVISAEVTAGRRILIVAHGNSLRALVKHLDKVSDQDITSLNIPTGIPLVYRLDDELKPIEHFYLADDQTLAQAESEVKNQSSAKESS